MLLLLLLSDARLGDVGTAMTELVKPRTARATEIWRGNISLSVVSRRGYRDLVKGVAMLTVSMIEVKVEQIAKTDDLLEEMMKRLV